MKKSFLILSVLCVIRVSIFAQAPVVPTVTLIDRNGKLLSATMPQSESISVMIQGRQLPIPLKDVARLEPARDATGSVTWPIPGYILAKVSFVDRSESTLPVGNLRFPATGMGDELLLSELRSVTFRSNIEEATLNHDVITPRPKVSPQPNEAQNPASAGEGTKPLEGQVLNQILEFKVFYPSAVDAIVLRFGRDQVRRIEFGDPPLETIVETEAETPAPPAPKAKPADEKGPQTPPPTPQKKKLPVRARFDRIYLRSGDRLTGELLGPGLDLKLLDLTRKLVPFSDIQTLDLALTPNLNVSSK